MAITQVTRNAIIRELLQSPHNWYAEADELEFLSRLYDLDKLPSRDDRYDTARQDIVQHRVANYDWDEDWIFSDQRFGLAETSAFLRFLAETIHPEVRLVQEEVAAILALYNDHLRPDNWELYERSSISGRPLYGWRVYLPPPVTPRQLREAIAQSIWANLSAYHVASFCHKDLGLAPQEEFGDDPMASKRAYVRRRLEGKEVAELTSVATRVVAEFGDVDLGSTLEQFTNPNGGVAGSPKNIIFAADGPKPGLVFDDAINNAIRIVENAQHCLVYDQPLDGGGLSWRTLVGWWSRIGSAPSDDEHATARSLYGRLARSVSNGPERTILDAYASLYGTRGFDIPALLPQVYLHYDPRSKFERGPQPPLSRQRMDFLMLMPGQRRVVLELDGKQHYADGDRASPSRYAEMVREDRRLRLQGYEVYRFGGHEFRDQNRGASMLHGFFDRLLGS